MRSLKISLLVIILQISLSAQQSPVSIGPIPQIKKPNPNNWTLEPTPTDATVGFAYSNLNNHLASLPLPDGTPLTVIGAWTYIDFANGGCFGGDGLFYVSTIGNATGTPKIWTQDLETGVATLVGPTGLSSAEGFNGIAYDWTTGIYYGVSSSNLYIFDNNVGSATLVGPLNNTGGLAVDIAIDCAGNMYMHDLGLDNIYSVNKTTGTVSLIGPTGFDANFGQGMGYDYENGTLYLFAFNSTTSTAQLRTADINTGATTLVFDYGFDQYAPFDGQAGCGSGCPVGAPSNPVPPNGVTGLPIWGNELSWVSGVGTSEVEVWFGSLGYMSMIYNGTPISTLLLANVEPLEYNTLYSWRIVDKNDTCTVNGTTWTFTTQNDPYQLYVFCDDFENGPEDWTITNDGGTCIWNVFFPPYPNTYLMPPASSGGVLSADSDVCGSGTTMLTTATITETFNLSFNSLVWIEFDNDWQTLNSEDEAHVEVSTDGGSNWISVWSQIGIDIRNTHEIIDISYMVSGESNVKVRLRSVQPGWDWWWVVDNFCLYVDWCYSCTPPSSPTDLFATNLGSLLIQLNWQDNSIYEDHFVIERKEGDSLSANPFFTLDILGENATSYIDSTVIDSSIYTYRVKAYNDWGHSAYSNIAQVLALVPVKLVSFSSFVSYRDVQLSWITATETNNSGFEIFRSTQDDKNKWENIGFVPGHGTTTETQHYSFTDNEVKSGKYQYRLKQIDYDGTFEYSQIVDVKIRIPNKFSLDQNYPNPFNPVTNIQYAVSSMQVVTLKVFDLLGREVATLVNEEKPAGEYEVEFNVSSHSGNVRNLPSGIYFYQLKAGSFVETKKMVLLK